MLKNSLSLLLVLTITLFSFASLAVAIPACDTSICKDYFKTYKKYSKAGYADAMATLGDLYFNGHGTDKSIKKALKQYKSAAKYGSLNGQYKAAMIYLNNEKYKDIGKGVKFLEKAARAKSDEAAFLLGVIFYKKDFHERDFDQSDKWLTKAYEADNKNSAAFIRFIDKSNELNSSNYPELLAVLSEKPLPAEKVKQVSKQPLTASTQQQAVMPTQAKETAAIQQQTAFPKDDKTEVITITSNLHDMFMAQLSSLRNSYPQKGATATGSKLIGRSCDEMISCGAMDKKELTILMNNIMGAGAVNTFYSSM